MTHDTTLVSRVYNTHDLADNVRINFGVNEIGREFVAVVENPDFNGVSGQPLPGGLTASLIAIGILAVSKKLKFMR